MYCIFVLTPIYLIINTAMLVTVYDVNEETEDGRERRIKTVNVIWRFASIGCAALLAQYLVVL